jgi:hypothetical protein
VLEGGIQFGLQRGILGAQLLEFGQDFTDLRRDGDARVTGVK